MIIINKHLSKVQRHQYKQLIYLNKCLIYQYITQIYQHRIIQYIQIIQ